jgi:pyruvate/2-oxoglutarate dehydrogenase complex dihydrolipoamide acyltransferase (E2) component
LFTSGIFYFFRVLYTPRSLPQLIKYCLDIDCSATDGGIAPKNLCQSCLDKLQVVFEFKSKSQESEKYLKQIVSHSIVQQPEPQHQVIAEDDEPIIPYSYPDDEESLLQPMDDDDNDDYEDQQNGNPSTSTQFAYNRPRGKRMGEFQCKFCEKSFRYVKAFKNHMQFHKSQKSKPQTGSKPLSYYKKRKLMEAAGLVKSPPKATVPSSRFKREPQPAYDSISPYNSPAPYDHDSSSAHDQQRDLSPDFGALMLSTSQMIGDEMGVPAEEAPKTSRTGRVLKRPNQDEELYKPNGGTRTRPSSIPQKKTPVSTPARAPPKKSEEPPAKKPGPASKTRSKPSSAQKKSEEPEEGFTIEGFSEVDITKMLKKSKKRDNMIEISELIDIN